MNLSSRKQFFEHLQKIFRENDFDRIVLEQGYEAPFEGTVFVNADKYCAQIYALLNTDWALELSGEERKEIYLFVKLMEYIMQ